LIEALQCVICDGPIDRLKKALVAPFLAERIWKRKPFCVSLVKCRSCGFAFYNPRLEDGDLRSLYAGYRSDEYRRMRQSTEPWYTAGFNADLSAQANYAKRRARLAPILKEHLGERRIKRVLDHGGDHGDLVLGLIEGAEPFVYDISGVAPTLGVKATANSAATQADLIINSNVLEHVGFPRAIVSDILCAAPEDGLIFLEVPCEVPTGPSRILRRIAQIGIMGVCRPLLAPYVFRPAALYMMHEHVNYFTERSLTELMRKCGGSIISSGSYFSSARTGSADVAWCLGQKGTSRVSNCEFPVAKRDSN
jgi:Methyltransferase domain